MPLTVIFLSNHWHVHLRATSQIRIFSVDLTHYRPIYSFQSPSSPKSISPFSLPGNRLIVTLTLTLTLIDRETSSLSENWVFVTPKSNFNKETQQN